LLFAVLGDRAIDKVKKLTLESARLRATDFSGQTLTVQPRWIRLCFLLIVFGLIAFVCFSAAKSVFSIQKLTATVVFGALGLATVTCIATILATLQSAFSRGRLVQLDGLGLALWGNEPIPWRQIAGIDLKETDVKGRKRYDLMLALWPNGSTHEKSLDSLSKLHWSAPVFNRQSQTLSVPCAFLKIEPHTFAQAVKVIGDQFNSSRLKDWRYFETVDDAAARAVERQNRDDESHKQAQLLARLIEISNSPKKDAQEIQAIEKEMLLSMQRSSSLLEASDLQSNKLFANFEAQYLKFKWTFAIGALWIIAVISLTYFLG
jgi:hypothetical protein